MSDAARSRTLPGRIEGYGPVKPFAGAFANLGGVVERAPVRLTSAVPGRSKQIKVCTRCLRSHRVEKALVRTA